MLVQEGNFLDGGKRLELFGYAFRYETASDNLLLCGVICVKMF